METKEIVIAIILLSALLFGAIRAINILKRKEK